MQTELAAIQSTHH